MGPESTPEQKVEQQVGVLRRVALREVSLSCRELSIAAAVRNRMGQGTVTCGPQRQLPWVEILNTDSL